MVVAHRKLNYSWWKGGGVGKKQHARTEPAVNLPAHVKLVGCSDRKLHLLSLARVFEVGNFNSTNTSIQMPPWIGGTAVIKPSGNVMVVGCSTVEDVRNAIRYITGRMVHLGHNTRFVEPTMTCTVCSFSVGHEIDMRKLLGMFDPSEISYRPSKFPAVRIYHHKDGVAGAPRFTASVFRNGHAVVNGSYAHKQSDEVRSIVTEWLRRARAA